jgi:DHA1 family bicyclomycin/chloramphenicol resistance-like MFS transporter
MRKFKSLILVILLVLLPINSSLCIDMYLPAYSDMAKSFMVSEGIINLSMSLYLIGLAFGQLIYGPLADRFGRKKTLISGMIIFILASLICYSTQSIQIFLLARFIQALGACSCIVLCRTIVVDIFHPEKRTKILALISATNIFSPALAPLLGGWFSQWLNWRMIFLSIAIFGLIMLIGLVFTLYETLITPNIEALNIEHIYLNLKRLVSNRIFVSYVLCLALMYAMIFVWVTYSPEVLVTKFGIPEQKFGLFFLIPSIGSTLGALLTATLVGKFKETRYITSGLMLILIATLIPIILNLCHENISPIMIVLPIMLVFLGCGAIFPQFLSSALAPFADITGFTAGIIGFIQTGSGSLIGLLTSGIYGLGYHGMIVLMFILALLIMLIFLPNLFIKRALIPLGK